MQTIEIMKDDSGAITVTMDGGEPMPVETVDEALQMVKAEFGEPMLEEGVGMAGDEMNEEMQMKKAMQMEKSTAGEHADFKAGFNGIRGKGL